MNRVRANRPAALRPLTGQRWLRLGLSFVGWLGLLLAWQLAAARLPSAVLPTPGATFAEMGRLIARPDFTDHLLATLRRGVVGFSLALGLGLSIGLLMGWREAAYRLLAPLVSIAISVPPIGWIALLVVVLGLGDGPPLIVIVATTTPIVARPVADAVRALPRDLLEMAAVFRFDRWRTLRHVILPALRPAVSAAVVLALGFTWRVLVMAEFLGASDGLGNRLSWARQAVNTERVLAYLLILLAISVTVEAVLRAALLRTPRWRLSAGEDATVIT